MSRKSPYLPSSLLLLSVATLFPLTGFSAENLLLNPDFRFTSVEPLRTAQAASHTSGSVPFWETRRYNAAKAVRGPAVKAFRPKFPVEAAVSIEPGETFSQWVLVSEAELEPGQPISLGVNGFLPEGAALEVKMNTLITDKEEGEWSPATLGQRDSRSFPKAARGELTPVLLAETKAGAGEFEAKLENVIMPGGKGEPRQPIALEVIFKNTGTQAAWIYAPRLVHGANVLAAPVAGKELPEYYRSLPRTVSKLHAGEPLHIIVMGSSIDRASANPPLYRYDEDPSSPTFKQSVSKGDLIFVGEEIGKPELTPYYGWWAHYYNYAGRLRERLMNRFDLPAEKLLINFMAADGSSIGESHSALALWSSLKDAPAPERNGHAAGSQWQKLYPGLFERAEGPRPDLVIFGSGANEKIDGKDEVAAFEGAIRWYQRHYPGTEFVIAMWHNQEGYTSNAAMMRQLALRYGLPCIEIGRELHLLTRHADVLQLTPRDGHPQAAAHDLWGRFLERAFQMADPMSPGLPQAYLPERLSPYTLNWEGELTHYPAASPRFYQKRAFILDDAQVNVWASGKPPEGSKLEIIVDGLPSTHARYANDSRMVPMAPGNERNSTFAIGRLSLGDRHLVELKTPGMELVRADAKSALNRTWHPISSTLWQGRSTKPTPFVSQWGAPYGTEKLTLAPGEKVTLEWVGTMASVAWLQQNGGGTLVAKTAETSEPLKRATGEATALADGSTQYMEDRAALPQIPYGVHRLEISAEGGPVALLGVFAYDTRPNRAAERVQQGVAAPGDKIVFSAPYQATPVVQTTGGLKVETVSKEAISFSGTTSGTYQTTGQ